MNPVLIYALHDPRTNKIRYVGKTNQKLSYRITAHLQATENCHRVHWLSALKKLGLKPTASILETVSDGNCWKERERFWIAKLKAEGANLTNNTIGGDGVSGLPEETRKRMAAVWIGRKHKPETIAKLIAARSKRTRHSEESKLKMSIAHAGRKITWADKIAESVRKLTPEKAGEILRRLNDGELVKNLAREFGMHRTSISKIKTGTYFTPCRNRNSDEKIRMMRQAKRELALKS